MNIDRLDILTEKLIQINARIKDKSIEVIDIDLLLDYVRVVYSDLLDIRTDLIGNNASENKNLQNDRVGEGEKDVLQSIVLETPTFVEVPTETMDKSISEISEDSTQSESSNTIFVEKNHLDTPSFLDKVLESKPSKKRDIRQLITINDKFLFMSELFNNDKFDYESALDIINGFSNYHEAEKWIDETYFSTNIWNKEKQIILSFIDTIKSMFK